jgi:hypothetical protein
MHLEYLGQHLDIPAVSIGNSNRWYAMEDYVLHSAHLSRWGLITMSFHVFSLLCYLQSIVAEISPQSHRHVLVLTQLYVGHCLGVWVTFERQEAHNWMTMFGTLFKRVDSEFEVALRKPLMYWRQFFHSVPDSGLGVLYKEPWRSGALQESFGAGSWTCIPVCHKKGFVQSLERSILFSVFRVVQFACLIFDLEVTWLWDDWWHNRHSN